jgi:tetratricopeptide (TPR) repeat protein
VEKPVAPGSVLSGNQHAEAAKRYRAALPLFRKVENVAGVANCIGSLGDIAFERSNYAEARRRFDAARRLYTKALDVAGGEAFCIEGLGDIALRQSRHEEARRHYKTALRLHRRVDLVLGEANCVQGLGDVEEEENIIPLACECWRKALALFVKIPSPYSIGFAHIRLARRAATQAEAAKHAEAARKAWESIGRRDLIDEYFDKGA